MASIEIKITHPNLTRSVTLTVADNRLLEFVDAARTHIYGTPKAPKTRIETVDKLLADLANTIRNLYSRAKRKEAAAPIPPLDS